MNKKKIMIICGVLLLMVISYTIFVIADTIRINNGIKTLKSGIEKVNAEIKTEIKNKKIISEADKDFLKNAYFDRDGDYFENYIREVFKKHNASFKIYHSKLDQKDYAQINLNFKISAYDFFKLINDIENGRRFVIIEDININKAEYPFFEVRMTLGAFYDKGTAKGDAL